MSVARLPRHNASKLEMQIFCSSNLTIVSKNKSFFLHFRYPNIEILQSGIILTQDDSVHFIDLANAFGLFGLTCCVSLTDPKVVFKKRFINCTLWVLFYKKNILCRYLINQARNKLILSFLYQCGNLTARPICQKGIA